MEYNFGYYIDHIAKCHIAINKEKGKITSKLPKPQIKKLHSTIHIAIFNLNLFVFGFSNLVFRWFLAIATHFLTLAMCTIRKREER
jgi:hypothetical protein